MSGLTQEEVRRWFDCDGHSLLWKEAPPRSNIKVGATAGNTHPKTGYVQVRLRGKDYRVHRLVFLWHHGYTPEFVDHRDHVRHHNNISNLRECTSKENACNRRARVTATSQYKGITWAPDKMKWRARASDAEGKEIHLGYHEDEVVAARAYDTYAINNFEEFANINFPLDMG